jgi:uncharacterized protein
MRRSIIKQRQSARAIAQACLAIAAMSSAPGAALAQSDFDHEPLAKQMLESHIRPGYADFAQKSGALSSVLDAACKKRDVKDADKVRSAFRDAALSWSRIEHLRFGPVTEKARLDRILDLQRTGEGQVKKIIEKRDASVLTVADLQKKDAGVQGLSALEMLLYPKTDAALADTEDGKFACGYAVAISGNLSEIAKELVAAWSDGGAFVGVWSKPGAQNALYKTADGPTLELLQAFRLGINNVREIKLLMPLGTKRLSANGPFAPKSRPPFDLSGLSVSTIAANIDGTLDLFDKGGFADRLTVGDADSTDLIKTELGRATKLARQVEPAGVAAFADKANTDKLAGMVKPLFLAFKLGGDALEMKIAGKLAGFSDNDGD